MNTQYFKQYIPLILVLYVLAFFSCGDKNSTDAVTDIPYDPNEPVTLSRFYPDSGGMATQILLEGSNFGNNENEVKVYFNQKRAAVVRSTGEMIYAITPRQPGDTCTLSVVINGDSVVYEQPFIYHTNVTVSTICGVPGSTEQKGGTLAEAQFLYPRYLTVDHEKNIYLNDRNVTVNSGIFYLINEENNLVMPLASNLPMSNSPSMDPTGTKVLLPIDVGLSYYEFDTQMEYSMRKYTIHKTGEWASQYKLSFAPCAIDGMLYWYGRYNSHILRIDPNTRECTSVSDVKPSAWYFVAFDPLEPHMLYAAANQLSAIFRYNILTDEFELYAGTQNVKGHADGNRKEALFNTPGQIFFDSDGNLFIPDVNNHCIRQIDRNGIVSTVIGIPGKSGYVDGGPDYALFNQPWGVTVDKDDVVYIADMGNKCVRKLAIE